MAFTWDKNRRLYIRSNGEAVDDETTYDWMAAASFALAGRIGRRSQRLQDAAETAATDEDGFRQAFQDWNIDNTTDIQAGYLASAAVAFGGILNATPEQLQLGEDEARRQGGFWVGVVSAVIGGLPLDGRFVQRTQMYGEGIFANYANAVRYREAAAGMTEERRILGASDHCVDCLEQQALGWGPIGSRRAIGDSVCKTRCHCRFQFR